MLCVWLPLNGDLCNQGLSNVVVTNNGATVDNNGKIGKCYYFNGSSHIRISMPSDMTTILNSAVCAWIKSTSSTLALGGISHDTDASKAGCTLYTSGWQISGAGGWKYVSAGSVANTNVWHHVCCTIDNTTVTTYLNGIQIASATLSSLGVTATNITSANFIEIGCDHPGGDEYLTGYVNDFRIYNHCLSAKEVEEIAKGLVLHYPLNNNGMGQPNLLKSKPFSGGHRWTAINDGYGVKIDWTSYIGDTYFYFTLADGVTLIEGNTYTLSFYCSGVGDSPVTFYWCNLSSNSELRCLLHNGLNILTFTMPSTNITHPFFDDINRDSTLDNLQMSYFKLEEGSTATPWCPSTAELGLSANIVYDTSCYGYNGTITGSLTTSTPSSRYSCATYLENHNYITYLLPQNMYHATYSFWVKASSYKGYGVIHSQLNNPSGGNVPWFAVNTEGAAVWAYFGNNSPNYTKSTGSLSTNTWHHLVYVWNNGVAQWYVDGAPFGNSVTYTTRNYITNGVNAAIGNSYTGTSWNGTPFDGQLSDFRIYATALTAAQIKELYNTPMSIDNLGNTYVRELVE